MLIPIKRAATPKRKGKAVRWEEDTGVGAADVGLRVGVGAIEETGDLMKGEGTLPGRGEGATVVEGEETSEGEASNSPSSNLMASLKSFSKKLEKELGGKCEGKNKNRAAEKEELGFE
jgi:hypothetical protein